MSDDKREQARMTLEDAVYRMLDAGFTPDEIKAECEYALEAVE